MKKAKQRNLYEDKSDAMGDLDLQFDGDDDDIIDLEDIIEMPDRPIDEDEDLDLDAEVFDVDEELQSPPPRAAHAPAGRSAKKSAQEVEDEKLLESFGAESDEDETLFEPTASVSTGKPSVQNAQTGISDEGEESGLEDLLAEPDPAEVQRAKQAALRARAEAALKVEDQTQPEEEAFADSSEAVAAAGAAGASISEISAAAEELIGRIESRLQEHIRVVVESMLPDLVRSIIDEEITKLEKELE